MRIHFNGHNSMGNRGCEAILRGTVCSIKKINPETYFQAPSIWPKKDAAQIQDLGDVELVPYRIRRSELAWRKFVQKTRSEMLERTFPFRPVKSLCESIDKSDLILSIGGDNYSTDYGYPSLVMAADKQSLHVGKPTILWGASVGPFNVSARGLDRIKSHLSSFDALFVREPLSEEYLTGLGLSNVKRMPDPAFFMKPEMPKLRDLHFDRGEWIGLNVSPIVLQRNSEVIYQYANWIKWVEKEMKRRVLLVPHVVPHHGRSSNNDSSVLEMLKNVATANGSFPCVAPEDLNAAEYKWLVGQCDAFIGGRTHTTIAAWSNTVPCLAIGYSLKSRGLSLDLFGNEDFVLDKNKVTTRRLIDATEMLLGESNSIKSTLKSRLEQYVPSMEQAVKFLVSRVKNTI